MFQYWDIVGTLAFLALNLYLFRKHAYWTSRNVPFRQPGFLYGNTKAMGRTEQVGKFFQSFYTDLKGLNPLVGMYHYLRPIALITDLGLVKRVLEVDFQCFQGRGSYCDEKVDPLSGRLYNLSGDRWNKIHNIIAPLFGENNLKTMFSMLLTSGKHLRDQLGDKVEVGKEIEIKNWLKQYIPDLMAKSYLGVDIQLKTISRQEKFKGFLMNYMSKLARILRISEFKPEVSKHFLKLISAETESRSKNNIRKDDFLDMLIQQLDPNKSKEGQLSFNELAAQAFGFYYAGLETCPALLTWTLYELSNAQVMQKKARQHVKTALAKFNGEICFDSISAMTYLDQIVNGKGFDMISDVRLTLSFAESLRKYPPIPVLIRETTKNYQIPNTTTTLEAGTPIYIPVYAIHHDPELYPTPEKFNPERFSMNAKREPYTWIPFGEGPRACLGKQLSIMQAKIVLAYLLINFRFSIGKKCSMPLQVDVTSFVLTPKNLWLKVERI